MEKIRSYDTTMLARAAHVLPEIRTTRKTHTLFIASDRQDLGIVNYSTVIAEKMYQEHREWTEKKFQPLIPYLQRKNQSSDSTISEIKKNYTEGLKECISYISKKTPGKVDVQDSIVAYTKNFISMLGTCKRLNVNPNVAIQLARESYKIDASKLVQLYKEHADLPRVVIERASTNNNPDGFIKDYMQVKDKFYELSANKKYYSLREQTIIHAAILFGGTNYRFGDTRQNPEKFLDSLIEDTDTDLDLDPARPFLSEFSKRYANIEPDIEPNITIDVPLLRQRHVNWCGYTSVSMVLQYYGYRHLTPEKLFTHINGEYDTVLEYMSAGPGPDIDSLALAVRELTPLRPLILEKKDFDNMRKKNPQNDSPLTVLKRHITNGIPCIIRMPHHFLVVTGQNTEKERYFVNNPFNDKRRGSTSEEGLDRIWSAPEDGYPRDARYLMLAIYPPRDKKE